MAAWDYCRPTCTGIIINVMHDHVGFRSASYICGGPFASLMLSEGLVPAQVVLSNDKKRFVIDDTTAPPRIRAAQGHRLGECGQGGMRA